MYKLLTPQNGEDRSFASAYAVNILKEITEYLGGKELVIPIKKYGNAIVKVDNGSLTERFLRILSDENQLIDYLCYGFKEQLQIIKKLKEYAYPNDKIFNRLGMTAYRKYYNGVSIDHFNEIMYDIFVTKIYDSEDDVFDKASFVHNSGLRVCPYCGKEWIMSTNRTKRQIDHFLPKRKYPFFALNFYNLIPSCDLCNENPNKGQKDPLDNNKYGLIYNPYIFKDTNIRFSFWMDKENLFNDDNFHLLLGYKTSEEQKGYDEFFDMSDRYEKHNVETANVVRVFMKRKASSFYQGFNIDDNWLNHMYNDLFAYDANNAIPSQQMLFKMKNDIFCQLTGIRKEEDFYTKRMAGRTETLR